MYRSLDDAIHAGHSIDVPDKVAIHAGHSLDVPDTVAIHACHLLDDVDVGREEAGAVHIDAGGGGAILGKGVQDHIGTGKGVQFHIGNCVEVEIHTPVDELCC